MTTITATPIKEGDFLVSVWGYDQTNASFFKVTNRTPKTVTLVRVEPASTTTYGSPDNRLVPTDIPIESFDAKTQQRGVRPFRRKVQVFDGAERGVNINSFMWARRWDGEGVFDTIAAGYPGH